MRALRVIAGGWYDTFFTPLPGNTEPDHLGIVAGVLTAFFFCLLIVEVVLGLVVLFLYAPYICLAVVTGLALFVLGIPHFIRLGAAVSRDRNAK